MVHRIMSVVSLGALLTLSAGIAAAQEKKYEGEIVTVDTKDYTFTVKGTAKGEVAEMKFHVGRESEVVVDGERKIFAELGKGDQVTVEYGTSDGKHTVKRAERHKTAAKEMALTGQVIAVDAAAHTFTVKRSQGGPVEEMKFHVNPTTRIYIGTDHLELLKQLQKGDDVTVHYINESGNQMVRHVSKAKAKTT